MARYLADIGSFEKGKRISFKAGNDKQAIQRGWNEADKLSKNDTGGYTPELVKLIKCLPHKNSVYVGIYY